MHAMQKAAGMTVNSSCMESFARSTAHGDTGSDWMIQRLRPSSETDGAVISFIDDIRHTPVQRISCATPLFAPNIRLITDTTCPPLIASMIPPIGRKRIPRPQFSM